ncbi:protein LTO1 homolog isoform X1 [Rhincodon typus]|uniref:protein LTO1 homolog isoform X1 n=1 Tax=Rhincodon typus TaxID=259920 RepID=UPI00202F55DD|nr:protein LTO1 homolog isoform X1 [Rhincodon typus]
MADPGGDLFDSIVLAEDRFRGKGYQEGFTEGSHLGETEGQRYGLANGAKIGSEVSFYKGFAYTWKCLLQNNQDVKSRKRLKVLNSMLEMVHQFPYEDPTYDKLQEDLEKMRAKFKQAMTPASKILERTAELDIDLLCPICILEFVCCKVEGTLH